MNQAAAFGSTRPIIPAGTQLNGIYEIDEPIAAGGMGEIYKGHAIQTGDPVAIKLIRSDLAEAEAAFALFRKEASALHNLYHEAIVRYYVFTVDPVLRRPYLAMEYVDGQSLSAMLRGGPLAFEAALRLTQRIAAGLNAAHERGIIHRDVSPDNVIIPGGDMSRAKIIDFGIARSTRLEDEGTVIGAGFAGKYNYVSPEQLGLYGGEITPKSDIYSLGLVLAEALRGAPIDMGGNHVDVIDKRRVVPDLGPVDERLRPLIEHMLQPDPADRPASMAEVAGYRIDAAPRPQRPRPRPAQPALKPQDATRANPLMIGAAAAVAVALLAAAPFIYRALRPPGPTPAPPPVLQEDAGAQPPKLDAGNSDARRREARTQDARRPDAGARPQPGRRAATQAGLAAPDLPAVGPLAPSSPPTDAASVAAREAALAALKKSLADYDGGDCFYARALTLADGAAAIEGFGPSSLPFRALDAALTEPGGAEPDIGVRQIAPGQCPAAAFLNDLRGSTAAPVRLEAPALGRAGETFSGVVKGAGAREAYVLLVGEDGVARLAAATHGGADEPASFSIRPPSDAAAGQRQLLVAIAAPKPLTSLRIGQNGAPAAKLFPQVLAEAGRAGFALGADMRSFSLEQ